MSEEPTERSNGDGALAQVLAELRKLNTKTDSLGERFSSLEGRVDARLRETRPIWEAVLSRLEGVETRLEGVEMRLGRVEAGLEKVDLRVHLMERKIGLLNNDLLDIRADIERLERHLPQPPG